MIFCSQRNRWTWCGSWVPRRSMGKLCFWREYRCPDGSGYDVYHRADGKYGKRWNLYGWDWRVDSPYRGRTSFSPVGSNCSGYGNRMWSNLLVKICKVLQYIRLYSIITTVVKKMVLCYRICIKNIHIRIGEKYNERNYQNIEAAQLKAEVPAFNIAGWYCKSTRTDQRRKPWTCSGFWRNSSQETGGSNRYIYCKKEL